jgi:hypothetical protein
MQPALQNLMSDFWLHTSYDSLNLSIAIVSTLVLSIEQKEESQGNESQVSMVKGYHKRIEAKISKDILEVLDKHLIPSAAMWRQVHDTPFKLASM